MTVEAVWTFRCDGCGEKVAEGPDYVTAVDLAEAVGAVVAYAGNVWCASCAPVDVVPYTRYSWKGNR